MYAMAEPITLTSSRGHSCLVTGVPHKSPAPQHARLLAYTQEDSSLLTLLLSALWSRNLNAPEASRILNVISKCGHFGIKNS